MKNDYTDSHTVYTIHDGKIVSNDGKANELRRICREN